MAPDKHASHCVTSSSAMPAQLPSAAPAGLRRMELPSGLPLHVVSQLDAQLELRANTEHQVYFGSGTIQLRPGDRWASLLCMRQQRARALELQSRRAACQFIAHTCLQATRC